MEQVKTVIIGAGQAGLATSYYLSQQGHEHILLEKDRIGEAWRSGKWDSFTLVTPNWTLQLPGFPYEGNDPDGFLHREEVVQYLENYAASFNPAVHTGVEVSAVKEAGGQAGFYLRTDSGPIKAQNVVAATGTFQQAYIPAFSNKLSSRLHQLHSSEYRKPEELPEGAVLIVGSGQSGCQIADELNEYGCKVYLCTGKAGRLPRRYRGKDSFWWAEQVGLFKHTVDDLPSPDARFNANPRVSGKNGGKTLNLHQLALDGVRLLGRMENAEGLNAAIGKDLKNNLAHADKFAEDFRRGVDRFIEKTGMDLPKEKQPGLRAGYELEERERLALDRENIKTVIWATGYYYDFSWIGFPVYDEAGYPIQDRGVTEQPGLYFVGLHFLHNRKSGLFLGVGDDAARVAEHIIGRASD